MSDSLRQRTEPLDEDRATMYSQSSGSPAPDSCCYCPCYVKLLRYLGVVEEEPPRTPQVESHNLPYQAPIVIPPATVALRTIEEERETERGRLLPKQAESSAPVEATASRADTPGHTSTEPRPRLSASGIPPLVPATRHVRSESSEKPKHKKKPSGTSSDNLFKGALADATSPKAASVQDEDDDFCPTCLEAYTEDNPKIFTDCTHHFHMPCILEWMERKDTCPMCETKLHVPGLM